MEATASAAKAGRPNQNLPATLFGGLARHLRGGFIRVTCPELVEGIRVLQICFRQTPAE